MTESRQNRAPARPRIEWRDVHGIVALDKPVGMTSNQALQRVRRLYRARADINVSLDETITGHRDIRLFDAAADFTTRFTGHNVAYRTAYVGIIRLHATYFPILQIVAKPVD